VSRCETNACLRDPITVRSTSSVMNIKWDYNYYQPWSDNEWLVDEMFVILNEDIIMQ